MKNSIQCSPRECHWVHQALSGASPAIVSQHKMNLVLCLGFFFLGGVAFCFVLSFYVCLVFVLWFVFFLKREQEHKVQWVGKWGASGRNWERKHGYNILV